MASIILASGSPRRRAMLTGLGLDFAVRPVDVDETEPADAGPEQTVELLARRKALAARKRDPDAIIIACDTLVFLDERPLAKPADEAQAREFVRALAGRSHHVLSGLCVCRGDTERVGHERTEVRMRKLSEDEIAAYVASGESMDKAGAYAIQGRGALLIEGIAGDYHNVVGLPLRLLYVFLNDFGVNLLEKPAS